MMNKKAILLLFLLLCGIFLSWATFNVTKEEARQPFLLSSESGSYPEKSLDDLIYETDTVVVGHFTSTLPSRWNTPNGKLPEDINSIQEIYDQNLYIYTEYVFEVKEFLKGNQPETKITIRTFGGRVGEDSMSTNKNLPPDSGKSYLLFLNHDPRLANGNGPGPFLMYDPATFIISDGKASSWMGEWSEEELREYIKRSPFVGTTIDIPDTPETEEVMQKIKASHDIEVEAKQSSDLSKLSDVFINDPRFPLNTDRLEFTKSVTNNPSLETAGYLDFKMAYIENGFDPNGFEIPTASYWIKFTSVTVNTDIATVTYTIGSRRKEVTLIRANGDWYVAGAVGITAYNGNIPLSIVDPSIQNTEEIQAIIQGVENAYNIEAEAIYTLDTSKLSDAFANDPRYPLSPEKLQIVRNATNNPKLEFAGYLDYKLAYNGQWETRPEWARSPNSELILHFLSINIEGKDATVNLNDGYRTITLYLIETDEKWYIAGEK